MKRTAIAILSVMATAMGCLAQTTRLVTEFGAVPGDGKDDAAALRKAAAWVRETEGARLVFLPGTYILRDAKAVALEDTVMSGAWGQNPEKKMFVPYHHYVKGLDFNGARNATVDAAGATLMLDGWMEAVSIENTENFTLNGLTINFVRKPMSEGTITDIGDNDYTVYFDRPSRPITMGTPFPRVNIWDDSANGHYRDTYGFNRLAVVAPNTVKFAGTLPKSLLGAAVGSPHTFHFRPAIFVHESCNTTLNDITINANCGMGIVGFHTNTVTMNRLRVVPAEGMRWSTNTDATHFASCEGTLTFDGCTFCGEGDDATNVHGYYHDITAADGISATLELKAPTFTHAQLSDVPRVGDEMTLVRISNLEPVATLRVKAVKHEAKAIPYDVTFDRTLPADFKDYYLINSTLMPKVRFENCLDWGHMARGVLLKTTAGAVVRNNTFVGMNMAAIALSSEANWKEGWHSRNVEISGNRIINCGTAGSYHGAGIAVDIVAEDAGSVKLHENITIENNEIISATGSECGIEVCNAKKVKIKGNTIRGCKKDVIVKNADVQGFTSEAK
jgi:hypothetical protein